MPQFQYRTVREMAPRQGVRFATRYYKQTATEYRRLSEFVADAYENIVAAAAAEGLMEELAEPLAGFRRTGGQANYSTLQILDDLYQQLQLGRDAPDAMTGRWNRALPAAFAIEFVPDQPRAPRFNQLFVPEV